MKLYDLTPDVYHPIRVIVDCSDGSTYVDVKYLYGSYSFGMSGNGNVVHLAGSTPLRLRGNGTYEIVSEDNDR